MKLSSIIPFAFSSAMLGGSVCGEAAGEFVIPAFRAASTTRFAYWDLFNAFNAQGYNYQVNNSPALAGGTDGDGHLTNYGTGATASNLNYMQTGTPTAFVTSSGAIYSFSAATKFRMTYTQTPVDAVVTNVVFQTQTGGTRLDLNNIRLEFTPAGGSLTSLPANFKALDDPLTGAFSERLVAAFQWNLAGHNVRDFVIRFDSPSSSMPIWQSQLDVVNGTQFEQALGFILEESALPVVRFGTAGALNKNLPSGAETRFFLPGTTLNLTGEPTSNFAQVGWKYQGVVTDGLDYELTFGAADESIAGIFCPLTYQAWRNYFFNHSNTLTQTGPDNTTENVSGKTADVDRDGQNNLNEFAFGGDPYASDALIMQPQVGVVTIGQDQFLTITYRRRGASEEEMSLIYEVQVSNNLQDWTSNFDDPTPLTEEMSAVLDDRGMKTVTARSLIPLNPTAKSYLRVKATLL